MNMVYQKKDREKGSIPILGSGGINGYHNKALVENSSLIIGRKDNAGNIIFVEQSFWVIDTTYFLKVHLKIASHYYKKMQSAGFEPASQGWKPRILTRLYYDCNRIQILFPT